MSTIVDESAINERISGLAVSPTLAIQQRMDALQGEKRIYRLGFGASPFPVPAPLVAALGEAAGDNRYLPVQGLPALREAVAGYHTRLEGMEFQADDILIGPGSKMLIFLLQMVYKGDLLLPSPSWVSYDPQARILGKKIHILHTTLADGWKVRPDDLREWCSRHTGIPPLLLLNSPGNPTGVSYDARELADLADVAREYDLLIVSDELYGGLHHRRDHVSMVRHYPEGTILTNSLSKVFGAGGWRMGACIFPPGLRDLLQTTLIAASETYSAVSAPVQHAATVAYSRGEEVEEYVVRSTSILAALGAHAAQMIRSSGVEVVSPDGGFYLFPDFSEAISSEEGSQEFCTRLLDETGVALLPGTAFLRPPGELTTRLAYVDFDGKAALDALAAGATINEKFLRTYCSNVLEAMDTLKVWLEAQ